MITQTNSKFTSFLKNNKIMDKKLLITKQLEMEILMLQDAFQFLSKYSIDCAEFYLENFPSVLRRCIDGKNEQNRLDEGKR